MNIWWRDAKLIIIKIFSCRPDLHLSFVYCGYIKKMVNVHWCSYAVIKLKFKKYAVLKPRSEKLLVNYHTNRLLQHRFRAHKKKKKKRHFSYMTTNPQQIMTLTHIYMMQWAQIFLQSKYKQMYYGERKSKMCEASLGLQSSGFASLLHDSIRQAAVQALDWQREVSLHTPKGHESAWSLHAF